MEDFDTVGVANVAMRSKVEQAHAASLAHALRITDPVKRDEIRNALAWAFARGVKASEEALNAAAEE